MKYEIYARINYEFCRQGVPEELIGVIDGKNLEAFISFLKKSGYKGQFRHNRGHFSQAIDWDLWAKDPESRQDVKEFHIYPCRNAKELSLEEWKALAAGQTGPKAD